jgi:uncharacterized protein
MSSVPAGDPAPSHHPPSHHPPSHHPPSHPPAPGPALDVAPAAGPPYGRPAPPGGRRRLHPKQVQVWAVGYGLGALTLVAAVAAADAVVAAVDVGGWPLPAGTATGLVAVLALLALWRLPRLAHERWTYELAEDALELRRGVVVQRHTAIPYFRVQHVDITRSPVERALGLSELVVRTAAASTDARIPGVAAAEAESLRDAILARAGRDDAV